MNKKDLIADMRRTTDGSGFITRNELAKYLHLKDPAGADRYIHGLPRLSSRYFIGDVADRLMEQCTYKE